jgi:hypothetical protein
MKKIMSIILVIVITAMCFTACGKNKEEREEDIQESKTFIITDEETGVQYIVYREKYGDGGMGGITPRYNSDGSLCITKDKEKKTDNLNIKKGR